MFFNVLAVDFHGYYGIVAAARVERNVFKKVLHNRMESPCADIFGGGVDVLGNLCNLFYGVGSEVLIYVIYGK